MFLKSCKFGLNYAQPAILVAIADNLDNLLKYLQLNTSPRSWFSVYHVYTDDQVCVYYCIFAGGGRCPEGVREDMVRRNVSRLAGQFP